jgi:hypothetical protein
MRPNAACSSDRWLRAPPAAAARDSHTPTHGGAGMYAHSQVSEKQAASSLCLCRCSAWCRSIMPRINSSTPLPSCLPLKPLFIPPSQLAAPLATQNISNKDV